MTMKKIMQWVLAATLLCGAGVFTACSSDDDKSDKTNNISEKIIGKWMVDELDGQPCPTNLKAVITFLSPTKAYGSLSDFYSDSWNNHASADVVIDGNKVTLTDPIAADMDQNGRIDIFDLGLLRRALLGKK